MHSKCGRDTCDKLKLSGLPRRLGAEHKSDSWSQLARPHASSSIHGFIQEVGRFHSLAHALSIYLRYLSRLPVAQANPRFHAQSIGSKVWTRLQKARAAPVSNRECTLCLAQNLYSGCHEKCGAREAATACCCSRWTRLTHINGFGISREIAHETLDEHFRLDSLDELHGCCEVIRTSIL